MLNRKLLLVLEQGHDIMEAVSQGDEWVIDVPEDLERETLEFPGDRCVSPRLCLQLQLFSTVNFIFKQ